MLRSRGASVGQLVAHVGGRGVCAGVGAAFVAPFIASAACQHWARHGTFKSISGGDFLPFTLVPVAFVFALGGAAIAAIATMIPAFFAARRGMVFYLRSSARPGKPFLQRYYLDLGLVGLAALALWQMSQRGSVFDARSVGGWSADPLVLMSPLLLILAIGALMFRFLPPVLAVVTRLLSRTSGPGTCWGCGSYAQPGTLYPARAAGRDGGSGWHVRRDLRQDDGPQPEGAGAVRGRAPTCA